MYLYISLSNIPVSVRSVMDDPYTELASAIINLKDEIVELQGIIENLRMTMIRQDLGVYS